MDADGHRHVLDSDALRSRARDYAASKGRSFTPMRERVLALLAASGVPLSAHDIANKLSAAVRAKWRPFRSIALLNSCKRLAVCIG